MKNIITLAILISLSVFVKAQNYENVLIQKDITYKTESNITSAIYTFDCSLPIESRRETQLRNSLKKKYGFKSMNYNEENNTIELIVLKDIKVKDLEIIFKPLNILLTDENIESALLEKALNQINLK